MQPVHPDKKASSASTSTANPANPTTSTSKPPENVGGNVWSTITNTVTGFFSRPNNNPQPPAANAAPAQPTPAATPAPAIPLTTAANSAPVSSKAETPAPQPQEAQAPGFFVKVAKWAIGTADESTRETTRLFNEKLKNVKGQNQKSLNDEQYAGLQKIVEALATSLKDVVKAGLQETDSNEDSSELVRAILEVNILNILERYLSKIQTWDHSTSPEDLVIKVIEELTKDVRQLYDQELLKLDQNRKDQLNRLEAERLSPQKKSEKQQQINDDYEKGKIKLAKQTGDTLLKVLFSGGSDSIIIPANINKVSLFAKQKTIFHSLSSLLTDAITALSNKTIEAKNNYQANLDVLQNFDMKNGSTLVELVKMLTSQFNVLFKRLSATEKEGVSSQTIKEEDPLKRLLPKMTKIFTGALGDEKDAAGVEAVNFVGEYSQLVLMHIFAHACQGAPNGNQHILSSILEKLLSTTLKFANDSGLKWDKDYNLYCQSKAEIEKTYKPGEPEYAAKLEKAEADMQASFQPLVDTLMSDLGVDAKGLMAILPHKFEGLLGFIQNRVGTDEMSPAIKTEQGLRKFLTGFVFQFYRDVIVVQNQRPAFADKILRYDETAKMVESLVASILPIIQGSLTDPDSEIGKLALSSVNNILLGKFQADDKFFADPIRQFVHSNTMLQLEPFLQAYIRQAVISLLANLAIKQRPGEKVDLLGDSIPYLLNICMKNINGDTVIPWLTAWKKSYLAALSLPEDTEECVAAKKQALLNLTNARTELFKKAAHTILNEGGWNNLQQVPAPELIKDSLKTLLADKVLPDLLARIYTDTFVSDAVDPASKSAHVADELMAKATPSIKNFLSENSSMLASKTNQLLTLSQLDSNAEALLGYEYSRVFTPSNPAMQVLWNRIQQFISHLTAQSLNRLAAEYKGEAKDPVIKALLQLQSLVQSQKMDPKLKEAIVEYKGKVQQLKDIDQELVYLKKAAVEIVSRLSDPQKALVPNLQKRLLSDGMTSSELLKQRIDFNQNLHIPQAAESLLVEKQAKLAELEKIERQLNSLVDSNSAYPQEKARLDGEKALRSGELKLIEGRINALTGQSAMADYDVAYYAALLNDIEKLSVERRKKCLDLHRAHAIPSDTVQAQQARIEKLLDRTSVLIFHKGTEAFDRDIQSLQMDLSQEAEGLRHLLDNMLITADMQQMYKAEYEEICQILSHLEKLHSSQNSTEGKRYFSLIQDMIMQKRQRLEQEQQQSALVAEADDLDEKIELLKKEAVKNFDAEQKDKLFKAIKANDEISRREIITTQREIDKLTKWLEIRHDIDAAQDKSSGYESVHTMKVRSRIGELEKHLHTLKKYHLELHGLASLKPEVLTTVEGGTRAWNVLIHILEQKSTRLKVRLENTTPLQTEYDEIIAPFKAISKEIFKDIGFDKHTKMPVPFFLQSTLWSSLMDGLLPSVLLDFYSSAWVSKPETEQPAEIALAHTSNSSTHASNKASSLFATDKLADIATNQIKAIVVEPKDKLEMLAVMLKDSGLSTLDQAWLRDLFAVITKDEVLWSHLKDFVGSRLDYMIGHLSQGQGGDAFLHVTIKTLLESFKKHIKDKHVQVDLVINEYKQIDDEGKKALFRKKSTLFNGFADEILTKTGLNKPEGFGLAYFNPMILEAVKQSIVDRCFDYCLGITQGKDNLSSVPEEFRQRIKASDKSLSDADAASLQRIYESLFAFVGESVNDAVIKRLKGAKAPNAAAGNQLIDLSAPFEERWEAKKEGEWIPRVDSGNIVLIRKEKGKKPDACEILILDKVSVNEITPLVVYHAVCKHNSQKLAAEILEKFEGKCKEWNITLTEEFNAWFKQSLQLILEDDEVLKLLSNIPEWIKGILLKKMVLLSQPSGKGDAKEKVLNVNQIPSYLIKSVLNLLQSKGPVLKVKIYSVLEQTHYDYTKGHEQDKVIIKQLHEDAEFKKEAKSLVTELLDIFKFDPKTDLPPEIPLLKDMWESTGLAAIEEMVIASHLNTAKIEYSRAQQKQEWDDLLKDKDLQEQEKQDIRHDLDKGIEFIGNQIQQTIHKTTGIVPSKNNNTTLFADSIADKVIKGLIKTLHLNEPQGCTIFKNWIAQLLKQTLDDKQIRDLMDQTPQLVKDVIYKKLVQLADLTPMGEVKAAHPGHLAANIALVFLDHIAQARQDFNAAYAAAMSKDSQMSHEQLIECLRHNSEKIVDNLFNNLKISPKDDIQVLFVDEIWENFGKAAVADFITDMYLKTVKFYQQDKQVALEYVLNPQAFKAKVGQDKAAVAKEDKPQAASSSLGASQQMDQSIDLSSLRKSQVIQTEEARQVNNLLGVLGETVRNEVNKYIQRLPAEEITEPHKFAKDTLMQILKAMGIASEEVSPVLVQWGIESIEKLVGSRQAGDLLDEIPSKVAEVVLNKLVQLGRRRNLPLQSAKDETNLTHLPANIVIILLNAINEHRPLLKPIMEIHLAAKVEIQKGHELQRKIIKDEWRNAKATLRHNFKDDPKLLERKLKAGKNDKNKRLSAAQIKFEAKAKENDESILKKLNVVCVQILDEAFKKEALDINIAEDVPVPYTDTLWDKFGKQAVAGMMAEAYLEMAKPGEEKAVHEHRLSAPVIKAAKKYAGYTLDKLKNLMVFNTPGIEAGLQKLVDKLYGQGEKGKSIVNYIDHNKKAIETWFVENNLKKIAKSRDKGVNEALFSVVGQDLEAVMMQIFDNFTGNIKAIESQDPNFTYNFSMKLLNIFTEHLKAVNAITQEGKKAYMFDVDAVTMQAKMGAQLHPDMPGAEMLKELHDLKSKNEHYQEQLVKFNLQPTVNAEKIARLQEDIKAIQDQITAQQKKIEGKLMQGTYRKLAKYLLEMCNFTKPEDLPGPSLSVKKQIWEQLNGDLGSEMIKTICDNFLTQQKLNDYLLSLMQTINKKMESVLAETSPSTQKAKDVKNIKLSPDEMKRNQEQCLQLLKSLSGAFPNTLQGGLINFAARFNAAPETLERVVRESLDEMPVSAMIEQALISGAESLPKEKMPESQLELDVAKNKIAAEAKEVPGKVQDEAVHLVKNVVKLFFHSIKMKVEGWIQKLLGLVKNEKIKKELGFVLRTICFTIIGTVVKWILKIPFLIVWRLYLEKAVRRDAEINRKVWVEPAIHANLALHEADALMENLKKHQKTQKKKPVIPLKQENPVLA